MRVVVRGVLLALASAFVAATGWAEDPPRPPRPPAAEQVAERAVQAFEAKDQAALEALARQRLPSAWKVGDLLLSQGRYDVAEALARASQHEDLEALLAYLAQERTLERDAVAHAAVKAADEAFARRDLPGALKALEGVSGRGVVGLYVLSGRGLALGNLKRWAEAEAVYVAAADHAERLGWRDAVAQSLARARALAEQRGDRAASGKILERSLALAKARGRATDVAGLTIDLGTVLEFSGDLVGAEARLREGLELARAAGERQFEANALTNLGALLARLMRLDEAEALLAQGLALHESLGNAPYAARARGGLAEVKAARGDLDGASRLYQEAAAALERSGDWSGQGGMLRSLARLDARRGAPSEAQAAARRALEAAEKSQAPTARVDALLCLAHVDRLAGRRDQALATAQEAFDLAEDLGYPAGLMRAAFELASAELSVNDLTAAVTHARAARDVAKDLGDEGIRIASQCVLACALARAGDTDQALALLSEAQTRLAAGGAPSDQARVVANLGFVHTLRGDFAAAIDRTLEAKTLFERLGDRVAVAEAFGNLGALYLTLGDLERGVAALEEARRVGSESRDIASCAAAEINLGGGFLMLDRVEEARVALQRGLDLAIQAKDRLWQLNALSNLAGLAEQDERPEDAFALFARAAALGAELNARPSLAQAHARWARALQRYGHPQEALAHADEAVAHAQGTGASDLMAFTLQIRGEVQGAQGRLDAALADARASADALALATRGLSATSGDAAAGWQRLLEQGVRVAAPRGDVAGVFEFVERARAGRLLEGLGGRDALRDGAVPPGLLEAERAANAAVLSARSQLERAERAGRQAAKEALAAAEVAQQEIVERIQAASRTAAAAAYPHAVTPEQVRATLAPTEAFVAYVLVEEHAWAIVLTVEAARLVDLGPRTPLDGAIEALIGNRLGEIEDDAFTAATQALVAPLGLPASVRRVIVSPHGATCFVPFQALVGERTVAYAPSATARVLLAAHPSAGARGVLALGDPDYGARAGARGPVALRGRELAPLPGTREEARSVGDVVLLGKDANESSLARALQGRPRWQSVHLACHGLVDPDKPLRSALAVSSTEAGDGFLSVLEVYRMRVPADLVVLSACESGRGKLSESEGVVGFSSAFLLAGADRVITSLWKVDDDATRALMTEFYRLWNPKTDAAPLPASEALRRAQAHVRAQPAWKHPRFWAAWQLWGRSD